MSGADPSRGAGGSGTSPDAAEAIATCWLRRLCLFVVVTASLEFLVATIGVQIQRLPPSTDFASYYLAGAQTRDGLSPYDRGAIAARGHALGFAHDQFPFLYPPPFALAMQPLAGIAYPRARQIWMILAGVALFAALVMTAALVRRQAVALGIRDQRRVWILLTAFVPAALNSTSVHNDVRAGSVGCLLFLMFAVLAWASVTPGRGLESPAWRGAATRGTAVALATLAKLAPGACIPWLAWRGDRRGAGIAVALLAVSMLPVLAHWGPGIVADYLQHAIFPSLRDVVAPPMNQSLDAFLARLFVPNAWVKPWFEAPGLQRVLSAAGTLAIGFATLRVLARPRPPAALLPVELGAVLLAVLALMKLTWVQSLCAMLFVWPALLVVILRAAEREAAWARRAGVAACVGFFLSSAHVPILWTGLRHGPGLLLTGVHLAGVLVLWGVALVVLGHGREFAAGPEAITT